MKKELAIKIGEIIALMLAEEEIPDTLVPVVAPGARQAPPPNYPFRGPIAMPPGIAIPGGPGHFGMHPDVHPDTRTTMRQNEESDPFPAPDGFSEIKEHLFAMHENETHLNVIKEIDDAVKGFIESGFKEIDVSKFPKEFLNYLDKCVILTWDRDTSWATATLNHCGYQTRYMYGCRDKREARFPADRPEGYFVRDEILMSTLRKVFVFTQNPPPEPKHTVWPWNRPSSAVPVDVVINPDGSVDPNKLEKALEEAMGGMACAPPNPENVVFKDQTKSNVTSGLGEKIDLNDPDLFDDTQKAIPF